MSAPLLGLLLALANPSGAASGLESFYLTQGLARIAREDPAGLGAEAALAQAWARGRASLAIAASEGPVRSLGDGESSFPLSAELSSALSRLSDYMALSTQARLAPVRTEELRSAAAAAGSAERIRRLFDRSLRESVEIAGALVPPELGGEALLTAGGLELREYEDPTRLALAAVARNREDPGRLAALLTEMPDSMALLDVNGQLERELDLFAQRTARGVPLERRRRALDRAVETVLLNASDSFTMRPREQLECIIRQDWAGGRLVGPWHLHPPAWREEGWVAAAPPSPDDREIARSSGQFLTIVFQPAGFDLHDLGTSPLGPAPPDTPERIIRHRSEDWRAHFAALHEELRRSRQRLTTSP